MNTIILYVSKDHDLHKLEETLTNLGVEITKKMRFGCWFAKAPNDVLKSTFNFEIEKYTQVVNNINRGKYEMEQVRSKGLPVVSEEFKSMGLESIDISRRMGLTD